RRSSDLSVDDIAEDRDPDRHCDPYEQAYAQAEEDQVESKHQQQAREPVLRVDVPLDPVIGRTLAILLERLPVPGGLAVEEDPGEHDLGRALIHGRVGITLAVGE